MAKGSFAVIIPIRVGSVHGLTTHIPTLVVQEGLLNLEVVSETVPRIPAQRTMRREARVSRMDVSKQPLGASQKQAH